MAIPAQVRDFLDKNKVAYTFCTHSPAYTAQGLAHVQHVSGKDLAKVVMVVADARMVMTVLPGNHRVNLDRLAELLNAKSVRLATEEEFRGLFPDCELGAMPPFGNLYNLDVWADETLHAHTTIVFNAGSHIETIQMSYADFERLARPKVASFGELRH
jgi:Ala-tRNA(Pro) deacylase